MSSPVQQVTNRSLVEKIADAVLYEGYILYPYRPSAVKNQQRWNFGVVCPGSYAIAQQGNESSMMRTECLVEVDVSSRLDVKIRFLHLMLREVGEVIANCGLPVADCGHVEEGSTHFTSVPALNVNGHIVQSWQEAVEREVVIPLVRLANLELPLIVKFEFPASRMTELLTDHVSKQTVGLIVRTQPKVTGKIEIKVKCPILRSDSSDNTAKRQSAMGNQKLVLLSIEIRNTTEFEDPFSGTRDDALLRSLVSAHTILEIHEGAFVSLLDPPGEYKSAAALCQNNGTYPVLVGDEGQRACMLSSPIILYDYPQIAPESAGDLFDGTEIDEILTLRIMALTEQEKLEMRAADALGRQLLERTESLSPEQLMNLHGVMKKA